MSFLDRETALTKSETRVLGGNVPYAIQTLTVLFADLACGIRVYQTEGDVEAHLRVNGS